MARLALPAIALTFGLLFCIQCQAQDLNLIVEVENLGKFQGKATTTQIGKRPYAQFLGIPYAKAPVNESRFLPAEPTGRLTEGDEIFDATRIGNSCIQPDGFGLHNTETVEGSLEYAAGNTEHFEAYQKKHGGQRSSRVPPLGSEDCLVLNIFTPKVPNETTAVSLPVIVFIHGGAFSSGNGDLYTGKKLLDHDVVLVSINYRLGLLGFFSLQTNEAPGNAAMYDMISALQWVQEHIHAFGGNPNLVTIAGQSAGSAAVSHLVLSPMSKSPKQLFHRAISLSGSALNSWAVTDNPISPGLRVAELATCYNPAEDVDDQGNPNLGKVVNCMKFVDTEKLTNALNEYQHEERREGRLGFDALAPVVQTTAAGTMFLSKHPNEILLNGEQLDIPIIMGATKHDGTFPLGVTYNRFLNCKDCGDRLDNDTFLQHDLVPKLLQSMGVEDDTLVVYDTLSDSYLQDSRYSGKFEDMMPGLIDLHSSFFFKAGAYRTLELHSRKNPNSYWYSFDFAGTYSLFSLFFPHPPPPIPPGVAHSDDLLYIFHFFSHVNDYERNVSRNLVNYWVNFAYNGDPNVFPTPDQAQDLPLWPAYNDVTTEYLKIDKEFTVDNQYMRTWVNASVELVPVKPVAPEIPLLIDVPALGKIQGKKTTSQLRKRPYAQFLGIPYAKPPTAESRFLPPEPTGRLTEADDQIFDATSIGMSCVQPDGFNKFSEESKDRVMKYAAGNESVYTEYEKSHTLAGHLGEEDCLYLNVFTPYIPAAGDSEDKLLPVIVFIHGGAFTSGNGDLYTGKKLLDHDVVQISFNYRLGILGFFCLDTQEAPGNAAFYDMITLLQWVQKNIRAFGGNPNLVTLAGQSAGAAAVSHLTLSPISQYPQPLFHRAISMSGSAMNSWAITETPVRAALRIAELALCYNPESDVDQDGNPNHGSITDCMKKVHVDNLVAALTQYQHEERKAGRLGFDAISPVVQKVSPGTKFLAKHPIEILEAGEQMDIPLMMGTMKHDGTFPTGVTYNRFLNCADCGQLQNNATFLRNELVPSLLLSMDVQDDTYAVYDALTEKYFGEARDSGNFSEMLPGLIDIQSVFFFKAAAYRNLELHSQKNPNSYWYSFDFKGKYTFFATYFPHPPPPVPAGVAHGDDLLYIFQFFSHTTPEEKMVSKNLLQYWVNFAYNGNPNQYPQSMSKPVNYRELPRWPAFDSINTEYLVINNQFSVGNNYIGTFVGAADELFPELEPSKSTTAPPPIDDQSTTEPTTAPTPIDEQSSTTDSTAPTPIDEQSTTETTPPNKTARLHSASFTIIGLVLLSSVSVFLSVPR